MPKCEAFTKRGGDCRQNAVDGFKFCENHRNASKESGPKESVKSRKIAGKKADSGDD